MSFDPRTAFTELFMLQQIKTGIKWADAILFGFFVFMLYHATIICNSKYIFKKVCTIKNQSISKNWLYLTNKIPRKMIVFNGFKYSCGYSTIKTFIDYPAPMIHIFDYMHNNIYKVENTYNIKYCEMIDAQTDSQIKTYVPNEEGVTFELYPDIFIELSSDKISNKDHESLLDFTNVMCHVKTYEHDISYIHAFVKMCESKFELSINEQLSKQKYVFKCKKINNKNRSDDNMDWSRPDRGIKCEEYPMLTNKHLINNCFFTKRDALIKRIDFFINNEDWYNKRGIPYQLTLVFEGSPGCGKTSTMKGIAAYTNRHIVDVDLNNITCISELENIFYGNYINGKYIPTQKRIFLIDEIDKFFEELSLKEEKDKDSSSKLKEAACSNNIVIVSSSKDSGNDDKFKKASATVETQNMSEIKQQCKAGLTRGQILSIMDGILESRGRFIICTANDTSKIDDTFKRPGRMDEIIHFSKCDELMINQIMDLFYNGCVNDSYSSEQLVRYTHIKNQVSPSDVNKICFNNIDSREQSEDILLRRT